jgi:hypothetical protein
MVLPGYPEAMGFIHSYRIASPLLLNRVNMSARLLAGSYVIMGAVRHPRDVTIGSATQPLVPQAQARVAVLGTKSHLL